MNASPLRAIPSVEKILQALGPLDLPRAATTAVVRRELAALRADKSPAIPAFDAILSQTRAAVNQLRTSRLQPVINATGIPLHTNLGRAPLPAAAVAAITALAANYNSLEYDLVTGERGSRAAYLEHNLALAVGAEAATVVNNCAAALVLMLRHFTRRTKKEVIISRGELVQIGGGFRIPDILEASGARLREVGTTNKTTTADYADAIGPETALILTVHRSNFYQEGFTGSPDPAELAALARRRRVPLAEDLGSGALVATERWAAIPHERTPSEALRSGVDLVCFSGDKLLGGPQAGIIAGKARLVTALKREPFFRALRCDKLVLGALEATVDLYLCGQEKEIPVLAMLRMEPDALRARAETLVATLADLPLTAQVGETIAKVGGGTMPRAKLPSITVDLQPTHALSLSEIAARLRAASPPVVGYVSGDRIRLDLRTVFPHQDDALIAAVRSLFQNP